SSFYPKDALTPLSPYRRCHCLCAGGYYPCPLAAALPRGGHLCGWRQPLAGALQPAPFAGSTLQAAVPAGGRRSCDLAETGRARWRLLLPTGAAPCDRRGQHFYPNAPPLAIVADLPFGPALAAASRPLVGCLGCGLAVGGQPCMAVGRG
ncbi:hypothetical protein GW17_00057288, partial [Ensete ventricosum]